MKRYVLIFVLLSVACSAQTGYRSAIKAGYGLRERRDSVLAFSWDSTKTMKFISDSLNTIPRSQGAGVYDSAADRTWTRTAIRDSLNVLMTEALRKLALTNISIAGAADGEYLKYTTAGGVSWESVSAGGMNHDDSLVYYSQPKSKTAMWNVGDTSLTTMITDAWGGAGGWGSYFELFTVDVVSFLDQVTIRHSYDSLVGTTLSAMRYRDTTYTFGTRDSLPAGAKVFVYYAPKSDNTLYNGTGAQIFGFFYMLPNDYSAYFVGDKVRVPLINNGGGVRTILASHRGVRSGHVIRTNIRTTRKIVGMIY